MAKYHVKSSGEIGLCKASSENSCPFSDEGAVHFNDIAEAVSLAEKIAASDNETFQPLVKRKEERKNSASNFSDLYSNYSIFDKKPETDPNFYTERWDYGSYFSQNFRDDDTDHYFSYQNKVYQAQDWEWNRAVLETTIDAVNVETGEKEKIDIPQDYEDQVYFIPKGTIRTNNGYLNPTGLNDYFNNDNEASFEEKETMESLVKNSPIKKISADKSLSLRELETNNGHFYVLYNENGEKFPTPKFTFYYGEGQAEYDFLSWQ